MLRHFGIDVSPLDVKILDDGSITRRLSITSTLNTQYDFIVMDSNFSGKLLTQCD